MDVDVRWTRRAWKKGDLKNSGRSLGMQLGWQIEEKRRSSSAAFPYTALPRVVRITDRCVDSK